MMNNTYEHVIFDLDGTLIDSCFSILASIQAAFDLLGIRPSCALTPELVGPPLPQIISSLLPEGHTDAANALIAHFKEHYDEIGYQRTRVFESIDSMLHKLRLQPLILSVATNKRIFPTVKIINYVGWHAIFDEIYALDLLEPKLLNKTEMLVHLCEKRKTSIKKTLYVGDRPEDAQAAAQAGIDFCLVAWGYASLDYLISCPPNVHNPLEILSLVGR